MSEHTKEPWRVSSTNDCKVSGADGIGVAVTDDVSSRRNYDEMAPNARRIVACVNACEGISTEDLELNRHPGAAPSERDRLKASNAELVEELRTAESALAYAEPLARVIAKGDARDNRVLHQIINAAEKARAALETTKS